MVVQYRFVVVVCVAGSDEKRLFEIPMRQESILDELDESGSHGAGARLRIWRDGKTKKSPIGVLLLGFEASRTRPEVEIHTVISRVGMEPELLAGEVESVAPGQETIEEVSDDLFEARERNRRLQESVERNLLHMKV